MSSDVTVHYVRCHGVTTCLENLEILECIICQGIDQKSGNYQGKLFIVNITFGATPVLSSTVVASYF